MSHSSVTTKFHYQYFIRLLPFYLLLGILTACGTDMPIEIEAEYANLPKKLDFNIHVKPILSDRCYACHGPDQAKREAGLRLDEAAAAYAALKDHPDKVAIKPKNLARSEVYHRIVSTDRELVMPPPESELHLTPKEKAILIRWIETGAEYKPHWAFIPPQKPKIPTSSATDWGNNEIDHFISRKLEEQSLEPSPQAASDILLRRLSFDLTGLPPSESLLQQLPDELDDAQYEKWDVEFCPYF